MSTGKKPARDAGKLLGKASTPPAVKKVAASDLAQAKKPDRSTTGPAAASAAGKILGSNASKQVKEVAASDLSQAKKKK
jgi:hypothetical protein